jgi:hypothetical protein
MKTAAALALSLVALTAFAALAKADDVKATGTWDLVADTPNGQMPSVLTLKTVDGKLKAEIEMAGVKQEVSDESLTGDVLKLKMTYEGVPYAIEGKIKGDTFEGTWDGNGVSGGLKGTRRP